MTAIVGTINRRGVAFAADSAATHTVSSKHKITNHANKIFELSRHHPVGICICGNLDFVGMPWEEIFKMYRKSLKSRKYNSLKEYSEDFFSFVKNQIISKLVTDQATILSIIVRKYLKDVVDIAKEKVKIKDGEDMSPELITNMLKIMEDFYQIYSVKDRAVDFKDYRLTDFRDYSEKLIRDVAGACLQITDKEEEFLEVFIRSLYSIVVSDTHIYLPTTELVFWGYGDAELFPSYYSYVISSAFDGRVKFTSKSTYEVSNSNNACVEPFAQTDVANTVIRGIDDELKDYFRNYYYSSIEMFHDSIVQTLLKAGAPNELIGALKSIDIESYTQIFVQGMNQYIQENYIEKLVNTVSYLSKEDLADMAESLVRMTYLKRRITSEEESVGGPVDVAVITKGDGFVWLKRKHYFDSELNPGYFERIRE